MNILDYGQLRHSQAIVETKTGGKKKHLGYTQLNVASKIYIMAAISQCGSGLG